MVTRAASSMCPGQGGGCDAWSDAMRRGGGWDRGGAAGSCGRGGQRRRGGGRNAPGVAGQDRSGGIWGPAVEVPRTATLNPGGDAAIGSVSCTSAGHCSAGGRYTDSSHRSQAFVVSQA